MYMKNITLTTCLLIGAFFPQLIYAGFTSNSDGTVTDTSTFLMWDRCSVGASGSSCTTGVPKTFTWYDALAQINTRNQSNHLGYNDWRLPNISELETITDISTQNPAINNQFFPATPIKGDPWDEGDHWSSTTNSSLPQYARIVRFSNGHTGALLKTEQNFIRLVRSVNSTQPPPRPSACSAQSNVLFSEDFTSTLSPSKWKVDASGGVIQINNGLAIFTGNSSSRFPFIQAANNPLPSTGDFSIYCKGKYSHFGSSGTSLCMATEKIITPGSVWWTYDSGQFIGVHAGPAGAYTYYGTNTSPQSAAPIKDDAVHEFETCIQGTTITSYIDGLKVKSSSLPNNWIRPKYLHIGNPVLGGSDWAKFEIDQVEVRGLTGIASAPVCTLSATPTNLIAGGSTTLTATCDSTVSEYRWSGGTCAANTSSNTCTTTPTQSGVYAYTVAGINAAGVGPESRVQISVTNAILPPPRNSLHFFTAAEKQFPGAFPTGSTNQVRSSFVYRFYPETGNYLGIFSDKVYFLGPSSNNSMQEIGSLESVFCAISPNARNCPQEFQTKRKIALLDGISAQLTRAANGKLFYNINDTGLNIVKFDGSHRSRLNLQFYLRNLSMMQGAFASLDQKYISIDQARTKQQAYIESTKAILEFAAMGMDFHSLALTDTKNITYDGTKFLWENASFLPAFMASTTSTVNSLRNSYDAHQGNETGQVMSEMKLDAFKGWTGMTSGLFMLKAGNTSSAKAGISGGIADLLKAYVFEGDDVKKKIVDSANTFIQCWIAYNNPDNAFACVLNTGELIFKGISDYKAAFDLMSEAPNMNATIAARQYLEAWYKSGFDANFMQQNYGIPISVSEAADYFHNQYINNYFSNTSIVEQAADSFIPTLISTTTPFIYKPNHGIDKDVFKDVVNEFLIHTNNQVRYYENNLGLTPPNVATVTLMPAVETPLANGRVVKRGQNITLRASLIIDSGYTVEAEKWSVVGADSATAIQSSSTISNGISTANLIFSNVGNQKVLLEMQVVAPDGAASTLTGTFSLAVAQ